MSPNCPHLTRALGATTRVIWRVVRDLAHTTTRFVGPMPKMAADWQVQLRSLFPLVYDTKHVVSSMATLRSYIRDSSLVRDMWRC